MKQDSWTLAGMWAALRKLWLVVVIGTILGAAAGLSISLATTPLYTSKATLYFSISQGGSGSDLNQGTTYAQNQMLSFAQLATSSRVLQPVIDQLGLENTPRGLARDIDIVTPKDTLILEVHVSAASPEDAAMIANAVAASLADTAHDISPHTASGAPSIEASTVDTAVAPEFQTSPDKRKDTALGALVGLVVGVLAAALWSLFDTRIPNDQVLAQVVDVPALGTVTRVPTDGAVGLIVARDPLGQTSEEFRRIRSALDYAAVDHPMKRLLVTSCVPGEGKSTTAANLALTLAGLQSRVLLIDADLRRPGIATMFSVDGTIGLTSVLLGRFSLDEAKVQRRNSTLDILPAGLLPPNPAQLLTSEAMRALLEEASAQYDHVVLDTPPITSVADANLVSPFVDGALIVVDAGRTRRTQLAHALQRFEASGGKAIGVVLNKARRTNRPDAYLSDAARRSVGD